MNEPLISAGTGSFTSSLKAISDLGKSFDRSVTELQGIEFSDLIAQQNAVPELLEELKGLLPEQDFSQIEAFFNGGNGLPPAAEAGSGLDLIPGEFPLPVAATLAVAQQQLAAAQLAGKEPAPAVRLPLSDTELLPVLADTKQVTVNPTPEVVVGAAKSAPGGVEQAVAGFTTQLQKAEVESITRSGRSAALQDIAAAVTGNPLSNVMKAAEAATPVRFGSPPMLALDTPLAGKGWEQGVGDRIIWMLGNSVQNVSLRINPAHLGPVEIKLSMQHDQATVTFNAQHAVVREALEASIPRLREMFQENNLQLAHVDVGQRGNSGQQTAGGGARDGQEAASQELFDRSGYDSADTEAQTIVHSTIDGLLNDYA